MAKSSKKAPTRKRKTPEELAAEKAFAVEQKIKTGTGAIKQVWIALAGHLHEFYTERMWEPLGHDKFESWLGDPSIGLKRSQTYQLIEVYEELVVKRGVSQEQLAELEMSKLAVVLPALRKGDVELEDVLADCEELSRSALREKYGQSVPAERIPLTECEQCGKMCRNKSEAEAEAVDPNQIALEEVDAS
jgi:hypothetical protein